MKSNRVGNCPLEQRIAVALDASGVIYRTDFEGAVREHLDFYLPSYDVYIEVKGGHSARISAQMARAKNVIILQGEESVVLLSWLLEGRTGK